MSLKSCKNSSLVNEIRPFAKHLAPALPPSTHRCCSVRTQPSLQLQDNVGPGSPCHAMPPSPAPLPPSQPPELLSCRCAVTVVQTDSSSPHLCSPTGTLALNGCPQCLSHPLVPEMTSLSAGGSWYHLSYNSAVTSILFPLPHSTEPE